MRLINKNLYKTEVISNLAFIIPFGIALYCQLYVHSILIFLVLLFSSLYHFSNEKRFKVFDYIFASSLIVYNLYLQYLTGFASPYSILAFFFVLIGFYFFFYKKDGHYIWHISAAIITSFCLLAYITST